MPDIIDLKEAVMQRDELNARIRHELNEQRIGFFRRLLELARECNAKHMPDGILYTVTYEQASGGWSSAGTDASCCAIFTSAASAAEAAAAMNEQGWELPSLEL